MAEKRNDGNQSLSRGISLIELLSDYPNGCPLAKIAQETGLNKSTTHRLLKSLQSLGYVAPAPSAGSYRLTSKFIAVGYKTYASLNIIHIAAPHMEKLNLDSGDTVNLSLRENSRAILIYKLEPTTGGLKTRSYIGQSIHLYCSGMGKVFLAFSPESYLEKYWEEEKDDIVRFTSNTIVSINAMRAELARIREERISFDREENEIGICCIAAPIFGIHNRVDYSLSVSLPVTRLDDERKLRLASAVLATADVISREIGGLAEEQQDARAKSSRRKARP
ncbi:MAG: IclR family transcriptional regulator [Planctomycetota bacterium]|jgi:DNA-binding IclR family transcriptional regulator|nr:IclR family transcriptional regulator [Planctomycetota bacterium]